MRKKAKEIFIYLTAYLLHVCIMTGLLAVIGAESVLYTAEAADHTCTNACRERLHTHATEWDETEYAYTCTSTSTYVSFGFYASVSAAASSCGHGFNYMWSEYSCVQCGEYMYTQTRTGCTMPGCSNYYANKSSYYNESHPGTHTYTHQGTRYSCSGSTVERLGSSYAGVTSYTATCATCGEELGEFYSGTGSMDGYTGTLSCTYRSSTHYYYVKDAVGGCYTYGSIHNGAVSSSQNVFQSSCGLHNYGDVYYTYSCRTCSSPIYSTESIGCSACGWRQTYSYITFSGEAIGLFTYYATANGYTTTINSAALHRTKTLSCTTAEYGDYICDEVVISLVPEDVEQEILANGAINTQAMATYLNGTVATVTCAVSGYDATKYNEWQNVTLSYGTYSSVSSKTPQTASIRVYVERVDFDLTVTAADSSMGSVSGTGAYTVGTDVVASAVPTQGYSFEGWYDGSTKVSSSAQYTFTMPANNLTLTAKFAVNSYTLKVSSESVSKGTVTEKNTSVTYKTSVTVTATPLTGFMFRGWYNGTTLVSSSKSYTFTMPAYNLNLVAKFDSESYTVSFNSNGGSSCTSIQVPYLGIYGDLPTPTRSGYVFLGWKYNGVDITSTTTVTVKGNHSLTAAWEEQGPEFIMVTYGAPYKDNSYGKLPTPSKLGYSFLNWFLTENTLGNGDSLGIASNIIYPDTIVSIAEPHTLHAGWTPRSYVLSFNSNGGTSCSSMTVTYDRAYGYHQSLPVPVRSGYTFTGWYSSSIDGNGYGSRIENETRVQSANNHILYAGWTQEVVFLKVTFSARTREQVGLTAEESAVLGFGSTIGTLSGTATRTVTYPGSYGTGFPAATRTGYTFTGWKYEENSVTENAATPVAFDHVVYAAYTPKQYTVTLNGQGATTHTQKTVIMTFDKKGPTVKVPKKTGYTFLGYFTGIRGSGTQYYDETGTCLKEWTETNQTVLYANWEQNEIALPEAGDRFDPTPLPEEDYEGSVSRTDGKALLYADDYNDATGALDDLQPYLTYDTPSSDGVIPGTELLSIRAKMGSWMLGYKFHKNTGKDYVRIYVTVPYRTQYERSSDAELVISARQFKTYSFEVPKVWSYWEVTESSMYYPDKVTITNEVIKGGSVTIDVDRTGTDAVGVPSYEVATYGDKLNHVIWPEYDADGTPVLRITLTEEQYIISDVLDTLPDINPHLSIVCENAAWADTRQASTKSDKYVFDGVTVLSDAANADGNGAELLKDNLPANAETIELTSYVQTYASGVELDELKANGSYSTTATITYVSDADNVGADATKKLVLTDINALNIHTPIACDGVVVNGIEKEDGQYVLVLKDALNFFTLRIDNTGTHRMSLGYGTKDFALAQSGKSNVAEKDGTMLNQVKFAFDVYVDEGNNSLKADGTHDTEGDYLLEGDTWMTIGKEEQRFFVPVTVENGNFELEFRTISVNCSMEATGEYHVSGAVQNGANIDGANYVATDVLEVEIKSYLKDFIITGTNDLTANKQLQAGNQALTLKKGYEFSFQLLTQGEFYDDSAEIEVVPKFYWESEEGTERQEVKLYHMTELPYEEWKECYELEGVPLLVQNENYEVILQCWGGNGMIPADVLCVAEEDIVLLEEYVSTQTITGKEAFFKRNGFLIVQLDIRVKSNKNVWYIFDKWMSTKLAEDALEAGWNYIPGAVIRYDLSRSIADDYEVGGVE